MEVLFEAAIAATGVAILFVVMIRVVWLI